MAINDTKNKALVLFKIAFYLSAPIHKIKALTMPSYTRPGVEAAVRLSKLVDQPRVWTSIEAKYSNMLVVKKKGNDELLKLDETCEELGNKWRAMTSKENGRHECKAFITCEELYQVMKWKFAKGKSRPLWKYINSNSEEAVKKCSSLAFSKIMENEKNINEAIKEMSNLKGVGPAGSSAILSLFKPDLFVFMDDEVIECLHTGKREYNMKVYNIINDKCNMIASKLGDGWTPRRVGRALWSAATVSAYSDERDLTSTEPNISSIESCDDEEVKDDRKNKRKRRKRF